jgi:hypothetical protein
MSFSVRRGRRRNHRREPPRHQALVHVNPRSHLSFLLSSKKNDHHILFAREKEKEKEKKQKAKKKKEKAEDWRDAVYLAFLAVLLSEFPFFGRKGQGEVTKECSVLSAVL